ncbi:uncharacterized protein LOC106093295 [Stomoxys calcitrans]|uniref:uncharacterized protein LOC106093295 n=1 Tax=Stomoxys calcitrans TaxID=35570 RepID=UPI0027E256DE|nr:uncharacterized protein LOC106093295 [Stomoxys calcitrans]
MSQNNCKKPKHILHMNLKEKQTFLDSFDIVLSDCDGVLWNISAPIPNAGAAINLLKIAGKAFKYVSNNDGRRSTEAYIKKVESIGARNILKNDFILPFKVLARHVKLNYPSETCYCIGTETFCQSLKETDVEVQNVTPGFDIKPDKLINAVTPIENAKLVIVDIHINMTFIDLALIHQYLLKKNCMVYINAVDDRLTVSKDLKIVGPGLFTQALVECAERDLIIFGKPSDIMAEYIVDEFQISERKRALFAGDNLFADIKFGIQQGFQTLFVPTGVHSITDMMTQMPENQPDYYADGLGDFVEFFNDITESLSK